MKALAVNEMRTVDGGTRYYCLECYNSRHGYVVVGGWLGKKLHTVLCGSNHCVYREV